MNIISHLNKILEESFNNFLKKYFYESNYWNKTSNIDNYINFMTDLNNFNYSFMIYAIKSYFKYIDDIFFHTSYHKKFCTLKGFYSRTVHALAGKVFLKKYQLRYNTILVKGVINMNNGHKKKNINTIKETNQYLKEIFIPKYNARFTLSK